MRTIQISEETFDRLKDQLVGAKEIGVLDDMVGQSFFFRTVTFYLVGKVVRRIGQWLVLDDASWVADSGRFMQAIKEGILNEVEPVGRAYVNMESITDFFPWNHALPENQK
jgi:hypothetical protein